MKPAPHILSDFGLTFHGCYARGMSNVMSKQKGGTQCSDSNAGIMIRRFRTAARIGSRACFQTICRMIFSPSMTMHINMHINKKNVSANVQTDIG